MYLYAALRLSPSVLGASAFRRTKLIGRPHRGKPGNLGNSCNHGYLSNHGDLSNHGSPCSCTVTLVTSVTTVITVSVLLNLTRLILSELSLLVEIVKNMRFFRHVSLARDNVTCK